MTISEGHLYCDRSINPEHWSISSTSLSQLEGFGDVDAEA